MMRLMPERDDFWRMRSAAATSSFKEWQHFVIIAPGVELIVNFSLAGAAGPAGAAPVGRVIAMARCGDWTGFVDTVPDAEFSRDGCRARFGAHRMEIRDGGYRVAIEAPEHGIVMDARLRSETVPITARRQAIVPGRHLDWSLTARLAVDGELEVAGHACSLAGAVAYHDHNWGQFAWGDDFTWEWGSVLPADPDAADADWAVVYSNLMNAARTELALEQVFVWRGGLNVLAAGSADIHVRSRGRYRARPALRLPRPLAFLQPRVDGDVPRALIVSTVSGADELAFRFTPESTAQLLIPSERSPLGIVTIHECVGRAELHGTLDGETIHWEGRGVFEFVR
jgi:hypothetical protein